MKTNLRLIGGKKLQSPNNSYTRPTTLRVREAIFNILNNRVENSDEGKVQGLGILKGRIQKIPNIINQRIPHMGWCQLLPTKNSTLFRIEELNNWVYFVHSYHAIPDDSNIIAAQVNYGSEKLTAMIEKDNLLALSLIHI